MLNLRWASLAPTGVVTLGQISTISVSLNCFRASVDNGRRYIFWKLWTTGFRLWFPKCIFAKYTRLMHHLSFASLFDFFYYSFPVSLVCSCFVPNCADIHWRDHIESRPPLQASFLVKTSFSCYLVSFVSEVKCKEMYVKYTLYTTRCNNAPINEAARG